MERPQPASVWQAIDIYLRHAYLAPPPREVQLRLEDLRARTAADFFSGFEREAKAQAERLCLRLGNRSYAHMKLVLEPATGGSRYVFSADAHDEHAQPPPGDPDFAAFKQLMQENWRIGWEIEAAWTAAGLPTFKSILLSALAIRRFAIAAASR